MCEIDPFRQCSPADLQALIAASLVRDVHYHACLESTNSEALLRAADAHTVTPLLVIADRQTAGRGRGTNRWWSSAGALTFSLVCDRLETPDPAGWTRVALTAGLAVCDAAHLLCPGSDVAVKWPNDVYARGRKLCGILIEAVPSAPDRLVVGIGINVNNRLADTPEPVRDRAISLQETAGYPFRLIDVLGAILQQFTRNLSLLRAASSELQRRWDDHCMLTGRQVQIETGTRSTIGVCQGIDDAGGLLVQTARGLESCLSGQVVAWE